MEQPHAVQPGTTEEVGNKKRGINITTQRMMGQFVSFVCAYKRHSNLNRFQMLNSIYEKFKKNFFFVADRSFLESPKIENVKCRKHLPSTPDFSE